MSTFISVGGYEASAMLNEPAFWLCPLSHFSFSSPPRRLSAFSLHFHPFTLTLSSSLSSSLRISLSLSSSPPLCSPLSRINATLLPPPSFLPSLSQFSYHNRVFVRSFVQSGARCPVLSLSLSSVLGSLCSFHRDSVCSLFTLRLAVWFTVRVGLSLWQHPGVRPSQSDTKARQYLGQAYFAPREVSWAAFARANQKAS